MLFTSEASNLVSGDTNRAPDAFVEDLSTGDIRRVSVSSRGVQGNDDSGGYSMSADGSRVVFISWATNLVRGDTNHCMAVAADPPGCADVFVHDLRTGSTFRVSISTSGRQADQRSERAVISADGRYVAFESWASTLVPHDTNECSEGGGVDEPPGCPDIFVRDLVAHTTERVSVASDGSQLANGGSNPSISADGTRVAFEVTPRFSNGPTALWVRDRRAGTTIRVPDPEGRKAMDGQRDGTLSVDGNNVVYRFDAGSPRGCDPLFAPPGEQICTSYENELYRYDLRSEKTTLITPRSPAGGRPNAELRGFSLSYDARFIMFSSDATNLVRGDHNRKEDVFLYDTARSSVTLVSVSSGGAQGNGESGGGELTPNGRLVLFESIATNLVPHDTNRVSDIFIRNVASGTTTRC